MKSKDLLDSVNDIGKTPTGGMQKKKGEPKPKTATEDKDA